MIKRKCHRETKAAAFRFHASAPCMKNSFYCKTKRDNTLKSENLFPVVRIFLSGGMGKAHTSLLGSDSQGWFNTNLIRALFIGKRGSSCNAQTCDSIPCELRNFPSHPSAFHFRTSSRRRKSQGSLLWKVFTDCPPLKLRWEIWCSIIYATSCDNYREFRCWLKIIFQDTRRQVFALSVIKEYFIQFRVCKKHRKDDLFLSFVISSRECSSRRRIESSGSGTAK